MSTIVTHRRVASLIAVPLAIAIVAVPCPGQNSQPPSTNPPDAADGARTSEAVQPPAAEAPSSPATPRPATPATRPPRRRPSARRSIRLARAPNMFGDFFNNTPCLNHEQVLIGGADTVVPEVLSPLEGVTQDPAFGGGPRTKVSDNFSPIPRHRIYAQTNYFHNLFETELDDGMSAGAVSGDRSAWLTTFGLEVPLDDGNSSVEFRLPLLHAPSTDNTLVDGVFGEIGNQSANAGTLTNLSVIFKTVLDESESRLISGGVALNLPTAQDVSGKIGQLNYSIENGTTNVIPYLAAIFRLPDGWMFQVHTQIDVPLGGDDFRFMEADVPLIPTPESGTFGTFEESLLGSIDVQLARQWYSNPNRGWIRGVTGVVETRLTQALSNSTGAKGSAAELDGFGGTEVIVSYSQKETQATYLNMTFGVQVDFADDWHLRVGQVIPLIDNGFTAETLIQLEKRLP